MHVWPAFCIDQNTAAFAARSMSASASTIIGSLPPSSSDTGVSVSAARFITVLPTSVEPVNMTMSAWSTRYSPIAPRPTSTWNTFSGMPHSRSPSSIRMLVSGVTLEGLRITVLPAASAGNTSPMLLASG